MKRLIWIVFLFVLSNECYAQKLKFFNIDLHIAVISDVKNIFESLGHEVESKNISTYVRFLGRDQDYVKYINQDTWEDLNPDMVEKFYQEYKDYLSQFDGFIVTHAASFALLYKKFNKPIIIVNSTRYSNTWVKDKKKLEWLNHFLQKGVKNNKIFIVSNNKADQIYLKYYTGLDSEHIPSLCLYTNAKYTGKNKGFILKQRLKADLNTIFHKNLIAHLEQGYKWQELYDFQGIIHLPYQISTMSLFEQYSANVPLFFPSKEFLLYLHKEYPKRILSELSFYQVMRKNAPNAADNPDNTNNKNMLNLWVDNADFYDNSNMPYIQYFDNFGHLETLLTNVNLKEISENMKKFNEVRKAKAYDQWKAILAKVEQNL